MAHDHHHGDRGAYYREQLVTIGVCGAFALVTIAMWYNGTLKNMLVEQFRTWVLLGGAALLVMTVINAVALWFSVGEVQAVPVHDHDHDHGHDHAHCDHDHEHDHDHAPADATPAPAHDHDGHDHGWAPWRYAVLLLPVAFYFVFPLEDLHGSGARNVKVMTPTETVADKGEDLSVTFVQLQMAAMYPENRKFYEGKTVRLTGRYVGEGDSQFTLVRYKMTCCAADAIPLDAVIMLDPESKSKERLDPDKLRNQWVQVTGRVQFLKSARNPSEYITALMLSPTEDKPLGELVKVVTADANPYAN